MATPLPPLNTNPRTAPIYGGRDMDRFNVLQRGDVHVETDMQTC